MQPSCLPLRARQSQRTFRWVLKYSNACMYRLSACECKVQSPSQGECSHLVRYSPPGMRWLTAMLLQSRGNVHPAAPHLLPLLLGVRLHRLLGQLYPLLHEIAIPAAADRQRSVQ